MIGVETSLLVARSAKQRDVTSGYFSRAKTKLADLRPSSPVMRKLCAKELSYFNSCWAGEHERLGPKLYPVVRDEGPAKYPVDKVNQN